MTTELFYVKEWTIEQLENYFKNTLENQNRQYLTLITNIINKEGIDGEAFLLMKEEKWVKYGIIDYTFITYLNNEINEMKINKIKNIKKWSIKQLENYLKIKLKDCQSFLKMISEIIYREGIDGEAFLLMNKKAWEKCGIKDENFIEYLDNEKKIIKLKMTTDLLNIKKWSIKQLENYLKFKLKGCQSYLKMISEIIYRENIDGEAFLLMNKKDWEKCGIKDEDFIEYLDNIKETLKKIINNTFWKIENYESYINMISEIIIKKTLMEEKLFY